METSTSNQSRLSDILKKKGIGPEASKSLKEEEIEDLKTLLLRPDVSLTTKATFLTALLTLEPTPVEREFIEKIKRSPLSFLPKELIQFISGKTDSAFLNIILKVISKEDLSGDEAKAAMTHFFSSTHEDYLKGSFLEAERLKRETFQENRIFFDSLWEKVQHTEIDRSILIDMADSYDGCNRTRHFSVFVAALIASLGYPVYVHSIDKVAPKEAVTSHQVLLAAKKNPLKSREDVVADIINPEIGWGHIDQKIYFPELYQLKDMRKEMVKRPFLATFEKLLQPIKTSSGNLIVTGYTHTHYREELINQLKHQGKCKQALVLKGVEGSTQISMSRETVTIHYDGQNIEDSTVHPSEFGLPVFSSTRDNSITPDISLIEGVQALNNIEGFAKENIIYTAAVILTKFGLEQKEKVVEKLKLSIESGKARTHWERGCE